jgi:hypothetical protein
MGPMVRELMMKSPLLALPLVALVLFFFVFVGIVIAAWRKRPEEIAAAAGIPLEEEHRE